jgi:hypothetical protein
MCESIDTGHPGRESGSQQNHGQTRVKLSHAKRLVHRSVDGTSEERVGITTQQQGQPRHRGSAATLDGQNAEGKDKILEGAARLAVPRRAVILLSPGVTRTARRIRPSATGQAVPPRVSLCMSAPMQWPWIRQGTSLGLIHFRPYSGSSYGPRRTPRQRSNAESRIDPKNSSCNTLPLPLAAERLLAQRASPLTGPLKGGLCSR